MTKSAFFLVSLLWFTFSIDAQHGHNNHWCATDEYREMEIQNNPEQLQKYQQVEEIIQRTIERLQAEKSKTTATVYTIPVVFHIIYNSQRDNISKIQIEDGLRVLNEDFRRLNADAVNTRSIFRDVAADIEIEFSLAKKDPHGNCTNGITRTQSPLTVNALDNVSSLIRWDNTKYLNVWVVRTIENIWGIRRVGGFASFPGGNSLFDGIVIRHDVLGTIGTAPSWSSSRTLTHEAGHYLNLYHTFQDSCSLSGDGVDDTPPVASSNYGCPLSANSCSNDFPDLPDMVENYMDYTSCKNMFTEGQKWRMRAVVRSSSLRAKLVSRQNLMETGIINPPVCMPEANFLIQELSSICEKDSVQFFDDSRSGGTPTSWSWNFPGGVPSTSNVANPVVYYPTPGSYNVSLTVFNSAGSNTITKTRLIDVKSIYSPYNAFWSENFESISQLPKPHISITSLYDNISFSLNTSVGQSSNRSVYLDNFSALAGDVDAIISPSLYTKFTNRLTLSFDYAFAAKEDSNKDFFTVSISANCGDWILYKTYRDNILRTAPNTTSPFIPQNDDWKSATIDLSFYRHFEPLLIKFELNGNGGNNFYLDNINFSGDNVGLEEGENNTSLFVYPNPARGKFIITSTQKFQREVLLNIYTIQGEKILSNIIENAENIKEITINEDLPAGVYFIRLVSGASVFEKKLIVN